MCVLLTLYFLNIIFLSLHIVASSSHLSHITIRKAEQLHGDKYTNFKNTPEDDKNVILLNSVETRLLAVIVEYLQSFYCVAVKQRGLRRAPSLPPNPQSIWFRLNRNMGFTGHPHALCVIQHSWHHLKRYGNSTQFYGWCMVETVLWRGGKQIGVGGKSAFLFFSYCNSDSAEQLTVFR